MREARLVELLARQPYEQEDERTLRSLLAIVDCQLGPGKDTKASWPTPTRHFLRAWILHSLVMRLLHNAQGGNVKRGGNQQLLMQLTARRATKTAATLWEL